jgi:hypothetical protein
MADASQDIEARVLEVIRERLQLRVEEGDSWGMNGTEGHVEVQLVLVDPSTASWSDQAEVLSSVVIDGNMLARIGESD